MLPPELTVAPLLPRHGKRIDTLPIKKLAQLLAEIQQSRLSRETVDAEMSEAVAEDGDGFDPRD